MNREAFPKAQKICTKPKDVWNLSRKKKTDRHWNVQTASDCIVFAW